MTDLDLESALLECCSLVPNVLALGGSLETLYHLYYRNYRDHELIQRCLQLNAGYGYRSACERLIVLQLNQYGAEYLATLTSEMAPCLNSKVAALRVLRHSRHYLPSSLAPLGRLMAQYESRSLRSHRILLDGWILPHLCSKFPQSERFIQSLADLSQEEVRRHAQRLVRRFLSGQQQQAPVGCELQRTDSCSERRHLLRSSSSSSGSSAPTALYQLDHSGSAVRSSRSKTPSPVIASLPCERQRECCGEHAAHQRTLVAWISEHNWKLRAWSHDGSTYLSEDDSTVSAEPKLRSEMRSQLSRELSRITGMRIRSRAAVIAVPAPPAGPETLSRLALKGANSAEILIE